MADGQQELERIRAEYERRAGNQRLKARYSPANPATQFAVKQQERALLEILRAEGIDDLRSKHILDLGCGSGALLRRFLENGASPDNLHGIDLLTERIASAAHDSPELNFVQGDAGNLPYASASFDIVLQFTVFSSILDDRLRSQVAAEMVRVLRPGGLIIWYDFWLNPTNHATRGIRPAEIRRLFPDCSYRFRRVTLAPPIARAVVPRSWLAAELLERVPWLRSHYLVAIRRSLCAV